LVVFFKKDRKPFFPSRKKPGLLLASLSRPGFVRAAILAAFLHLGLLTAAQSGAYARAAGSLPVAHGHICDGGSGHHHHEGDAADCAVCAVCLAHALPGFLPPPPPAFFVPLEPGVAEHAAPRRVFPRAATLWPDAQPRAPPIL
jgi:hypothetical protein